MWKQTSTITPFFSGSKLLKLQLQYVLRCSTYSCNFLFSVLFLFSILVFQLLSSISLFLFLLMAKPSSAQFFDAAKNGDLNALRSLISDPARNFQLDGRLEDRTALHWLILSLPCFCWSSFLFTFFLLPGQLQVEMLMLLPFCWSRNAILLLQMRWECRIALLVVWYNIPPPLF